MSALVIKLPVTRKGQEFFFQMKELNGLRDVYPDGSRLDEIDWDELALECEAILNDLCSQ